MSAPDDPFRPPGHFTVEDIGAIEQALMNLLDLPESLASEARRRQVDRFHLTDDQSKMSDFSAEDAELVQLIASANEAKR